jgi:hypothetical protein
MKNISWKKKKIDERTEMKTSWMSLVYTGFLI